MGRQAGHWMLDARILADGEMYYVGVLDPLPAWTNLMTRVHPN